MQLLIVGHGAAKNNKDLHHYAINI